MIILSILFFVTALIYSSVGFGGGSTYLAILLIWGVPYTIFPVIALVCNIIVVSGNSINFIRSKNINFNLLFPYLIGSIPFAFIGGSITIEKSLFEILLFCVLFVAGIFLLIESKSFNKEKIKINQIPRLISISIGSIIGFMSGLVGIGGGIFLSPILFLLKAGKPKHIVTTASLFSEMLTAVSEDIDLPPGLVWRVVGLDHEFELESNKEACIAYGSYCDLNATTPFPLLFISRTSPFLALAYPYIISLESGAKDTKLSTSWVWADKKLLIINIEKKSKKIKKRQKKWKKHENLTKIDQFWLNFIQFLQKLINFATFWKIQFFIK